MNTDFITEVQNDILFYLELLKEENKENIMKSFADRDCQKLYDKMAEWALKKLKNDIDILMRNK